MGCVVAPSLGMRGSPQTWQLVRGGVSSVSSPSEPELTELTDELTDGRDQLVVRGKPLLAVMIPALVRARFKVDRE